MLCCVICKTDQDLPSKDLDWRRYFIIAVLVILAESWFFTTPRSSCLGWMWHFTGLPWQSDEIWRVFIQKLRFYHHYCKVAPKSKAAAGGQGRILPWEAALWLWPYSPACEGSRGAGRTAMAKSPELKEMLAKSLTKLGSLCTHNREGWTGAPASPDPGGICAAHTTAGLYQQRPSGQRKLHHLLKSFIMSKDLIVSCEYVQLPFFHKIKFKRQQRDWHLSGWLMEWWVSGWATSSRIMGFWI